MKNTVFIVLLSLGLSLMAEPVDAQERMDDMRGEQKEKYSSKNSVRGQLFEWETMPCLYIGDYILSWKTNGMEKHIMASENGSWTRTWQI